MKKLSRRTFSKGVFAGPILGGLGRARARSRFMESTYQETPEAGYGYLIGDRRGILDLPRDFTYTIISRVGEKMSDGYYVPGLFDGMGTFPGPEGTTVILRNHEFRVGHSRSLGPFKGSRRLEETLARSLVFDFDTKGRVCLGSVTTMVFNQAEQRLETEFLSLVGTLTNCSGGTTPWGTWISCEESTEGVGEGFGKNHGLAFEVPVGTEPVVSPPRPLPALGRFAHEGVAIIPESGIVYQTEDRVNSLFYRFLPENSADLAAGGRLQALAVAGQPGLNTSNWKVRKLSEGELVSVHWIDLDHTRSDQDDLRYQGLRRGATVFTRGEGILLLNGEVYFACTTGGQNQQGQIWRYRPSPYEGTPREEESPSTLELWLEPNDGHVMDCPDQFCVAPWGDLLVCEDGEGEQHLLGITPDGDVYRFARNAKDRSELAGACFSPDGSTLFLNNLEAGLTFAITGPWKSPA